MTFLLGFLASLCLTALPVAWLLWLTGRTSEGLMDWEQQSHGSTSSEACGRGD